MISGSTGTRLVNYYNVNVKIKGKSTAWSKCPAYVDSRKREHSSFCMTALLLHQHADIPYSSVIESWDGKLFLRDEKDSAFETYKFTFFRGINIL